MIFLSLVYLTVKISVNSSITYFPTCIFLSGIFLLQLMQSFLFRFGALSHEHFNRAKGACWKQSWVLSQDTSGLILHSQWYYSRISWISLFRLSYYSQKQKRGVFSKRHQYTCNMVSTFVCASSEFHWVSEHEQTHFGICKMLSENGTQGIGNASVPGNFDVKLNKEWPMCYKLLYFLQSLEFQRQ